MKLMILRTFLEQAGFIWSNLLLGVEVNHGEGRGGRGGE